MLRKEVRQPQITSEINSRKVLLELLNNSGVERRHERNNKHIEHPSHLSINAQSIAFGFLALYKASKRHLLTSVTLNTHCFILELREDNHPLSFFYSRKIRLSAPRKSTDWSFLQPTDFRQEVWISDQTIIKATTQPEGKHRSISHTQLHACVRSRLAKGMACLCACVCVCVRLYTNVTIIVRTKWTSEAPL